MNYIIIIILAIILLLIFALNKIQEYETYNKEIIIETNRCYKTQFGCCPDGVNSRIDYYGTNCPIYNPGPGYRIISGRHPIQPNPIGGCSGTRFGCCPNNVTAKMNPQGTNCFF